MFHNITYHVYFPKYTIHSTHSELEWNILIVTIVPICVRTCDLESLVASGHKKIWRPPAANMGFCNIKDVVAFVNNQLWRPLAAKD